MKIILAGSTTFIVAPTGSPLIVIFSEHIAFLKGGKPNAVFIEHVAVHRQNDVEILGRVPFLQNDLIPGKSLELQQGHDVAEILVIESLKY